MKTVSGCFQWRRVSISADLAARLREHIERYGLGADDLIFTQPAPAGAARRRRPARLPDPEALGLTEPNHAGKQYRHGTTTAYNCGPCRCLYCKDALAAYRADRRAAGKDDARPPRTVSSDGHVDNAWFRGEVWANALALADLGIKITPHGLRHAHASWLLAGGADIQVVKERLGHGSIRTTELYLRSLPGSRDTGLDALMATWGERKTAGTQRTMPEHAVSSCMGATAYSPAAALSLALIASNACLTSSRIDAQIGGCHGAGRSLSELTTSHA